MNIQSSTKISPLGRKPSLPTASFSGEEQKSLKAPTDFFKKVGRGIGGAVYGAIPAVGTATNGFSALASGFTDIFDPNGEGNGLAIGTLGAVSNIAGTISLLAGSLTGSQTTMNVSFGLLGASAAAGAYLGFVE